MTNEIEEVKAQLKVLEKKLALLEELSKTKSPVEEAYKDAYGKYPVKEVSENLTSEDNWNVISWSAFQKGYNAAQKDYKVGEFQEPEVREWDVVRESMNWCKEHPDKDPLDWVKPQTPEQVNTFAPKELEELVKEGVVSSTTKPQTLYDVIGDWWNGIYTTNWDDRTYINNLVDEISLWLPKYQSAAGSQNAYVECTVEGFNDCLNIIKNKLR